jgi:hypothetical protein
MHAVKRYIELKIQSKIGVNATVLIGVVVTLLAAVVTFVFALVIVFIWLAGRYSLFSAALIMFGLFLAVAVAGAVVAFIAQRKAAISAEKALSRQSALSFVQPTPLKAAFQMANGIGWRRLVPIVGMGFLVAGVMRELSLRHQMTKDAEYLPPRH